VLSGRSYPSAHSSTSFAGARALSAAGMPAAPLYSVAVAMALSRPYLGVHYPSDIVAGAVLGESVARFMTP
jgi:undecaprenyl-diphosphatase